MHVLERVHIARAARCFAWPRCCASKPRHAHAFGLGYLIDRRAVGRTRCAGFDLGVCIVEPCVTESVRCARQAFGVRLYQLLRISVEVSLHVMPVIANVADASINANARRLLHGCGMQRARGALLVGEHVFVLVGLTRDAGVVNTREAWFAQAIDDLGSPEAVKVVPDVRQAVRRARLACLFSDDCRVSVDRADGARIVLLVVFDNALVPRENNEDFICINIYIYISNRV